MRLILLSLIGLATVVNAWGATPYKQSLSGKKNVYVRDGVFTGGVAGQGTSILEVRRAFSAKTELERVIVALGDREAKPLKSEPTYFQASLDAANRRLVLDISQLKLSKVSEQQVQRLFKKSPYVASVDFTLDPEDKAASMVVHLKRPMQLEVFKLSKPARIVMDLTPVKAKTKL
ncbi:MAG: hypothetical protein KF799_08670 [Bdellovibrionales bacterium]|nr:hypothetical protein [Bdellovibrionales bacterium]